MLRLPKSQTEKTLLTSDAVTNSVVSKLSVGAGSPDPAPALTEGLPLPQTGDLRSVEGHGLETVAQRDVVGK